MNFSEIKNVVVSEGRVRKIYRDGVELWHWTQSADKEAQSQFVNGDILQYATINKWISRTGVISGNDTNWISSDKLHVRSGAVVSFALISHPAVGNVVAYDESGSVLGYSGYNSNILYESVYEVPAGTKYITITGGTTKYNPNAVNQYATVSYTQQPEKTERDPCDPKYHEDGLILYCDGRNNTGGGHSDSAATWKDLSGNGNDLTNRNGVWVENGIIIDAKSGQFVLSTNKFDLGTDRTLEIVFTVEEDKYAAFGFQKADRYKFRISGGTPWIRLSESDTSTVDLKLSKAFNLKSASSFSITRHYNQDENKTYYQAYLNGVIDNGRTMDGDYRSGETSLIQLGAENDHVTYHGIRLYNKVLTSEQIASNYEYDRLMLIK